MCRDCLMTVGTHPDHTKKNIALPQFFLSMGFIWLTLRWLIYSSSLPIYNLRAKPCKDNPAHVMKKEWISKNGKSQTIIRSPLLPLAASLCQLLFMIHQEAVEWNNDISVSVVGFASAPKQMCHDNRKRSRPFKGYFRLSYIVHPTCEVSRNEAFEFIKSHANVQLPLCFLDSMGSWRNYVVFQLLYTPVCSQTAC